MKQLRALLVGVLIIDDVIYYSNSSGGKTDETKSK